VLDGVVSTARGAGAPVLGWRMYHTVTLGLCMCDQQRSRPHRVCAVQQLACVAAPRVAVCCVCPVDAAPLCSLCFAHARCMRACTQSFSQPVPRHSVACVSAAVSLCVYRKCTKRFPLGTAHVLQQYSGTASAGCVRACMRAWP
jgi:hypothetical protein